MRSNLARPMHLQGTKLAVSLIDIIRSDPAWKNQVGPMAVDNFFPDRWLTEEGQKKGGLQAFGGGARMCLGYNVALAEVKASTGHLLIIISQHKILKDYFLIWPKLQFSLVNNSF